MEIWGEGEKRQSLSEFVKKIGMEERIFLPGETNQVKEKLEKASLYLLSSNTEGMPNSLMEAMALGLAVISTDCPCGGPKELIREGMNGLLVPVNDIQSLADAMEKVLSDETFRINLGKNAMKIREELNPIKVNDKWEEYLSIQMKC